MINLTTMMPVTGVGLQLNPAMPRLVIAPSGRGVAGGTPLRRGAARWTGGLAGAMGEPVVASPAFFFARSPKPLSSCVMPAEGCTSATPLLTVEQAIGLERLRQALAPLLAQLEALGIPPDQVALAWTFTVSGGVP